jgi:hypothetical protein
MATSQTSKANMTGPFLTRLLAMFCRHQFSWPHTGVHGQAYQVCLLCGAAYAYDCSTMRRTGQLAATLETGDSNP